MPIRLLTVLIVLGTVVLSGEDSSPKEDLGFVVFRDNCIACHLQTGMGIREMNAPSIAGLPRWYVSDQLRKFRRDQRGFHEEDESGILMQANAIVLDEKSIAFVGRYIENLAPNDQRNTLDIQISKTAKTLYLNNCANCHGDDAEGKRTDRIPPLTSQQDWYLMKQMGNFRNGKHNHSEQTAATTPTVEQAEAIIAWISQLRTDGQTASQE